MNDKIQSFTGCNPTWCPGCGNHAIIVSLKSSFVQLNLTPSDIRIVFGIGCSGNMNDFLNAYAVHSLHGRAVPTGVGIKLAQHKAPVIIIAGDGDCYGEGGNHFIHACRGNHDIKVFVHNNGVYGLTTGQSSPTAQHGYVSKSTPKGIIEYPLNPLTLAIGQGATFVAQTFAGDIDHMTSIFSKAIYHKGFSLVNILQPCITFNKINTFAYYQKNSYKIPSNHDPKNYEKSQKMASELNSFKFPLGVIYETEKMSYTDQISHLKNNNLFHRKQYTEYSKLLGEFL